MKAKKAKSKKLSRSIKGRYWYQWVNYGCPVCAIGKGRRVRVYYEDELPNDAEVFDEPNGCYGCFG